MLDEVREICPTTARRMLAEGATMIDVRESNEVATFGLDIVDVLNIPLSQLESRWQEVPRDLPVIFACESGTRSLKATYYLQFQSYKNVCNMSDGIAKWSAKGFPVRGVRAFSDCAGGCCGSTSSVETARYADSTPVKNCC